MESERHFERYFEVFRKHWTPDELDRRLRWATPEQWDAIFKAVGSPEDAVRLAAALKERHADWEWSRTLRQKFSTTAKLFILVGAVVTLLRPVVLRILDLWAG